MDKMVNAMKDYETKLIKESAEYLSIENAQLQERIDKAIEFINEITFYKFEERRLLLEILKGESNE